MSRSLILFLWLLQLCNVSSVELLGQRPYIATEPPPCDNQFIQTTIVKDPPATWNGDVSFVPGIKIDSTGAVRAYVVADSLNLTKSNLPSLHRVRSIPNTNVTSVVFDARSINLDMPLVFDTANVIFYAHSLHIGPRGSIVLTKVPTSTDGVTIVVDSLDISESPLHPFVFITGSKDWPVTAHRLITVYANRILAKPSATTDAAGGSQLVRSLTLDETYAILPAGTDPLKPYSIQIGTPAAKAQIDNEITNTMLWPLETAEKIGRQFSLAPFDKVNIAFLRLQIDDLYTYLPSNSHQLARSVIAKTLTSINAGVDNQGFYPNYVPRRLYPTYQVEFNAVKERTLKSLASWDQELVAAQRGDELTAAVKIVDSDLADAHRQIETNMDSIDSATTKLSTYEGNIATVQGEVEQDERHVQEAMDDAKKKLATGERLQIVTKGVVFAASLLPVSAPVAIGIGTATGIIGNHVVKFNQGQSQDLQTDVMSVKGALDQATAFNKKATALVTQWGDVKTKLNTWKSSSSTSVRAGQPNPRDALGASIGDFVSDLSDVVGSMRSPAPTELSQSQFERDNVQLQQHLHEIEVIRSAEASVSAQLVSLYKQLADGKTRVDQLEAQRATFSKIDVKQDHDQALRQSLAWSERQSELDALFYNTIVLLRSYKYHTSQQPPGNLTEQYFESHYRLSGAIESAQDSSNDFFRTSGRGELDKRLAQQRKDLEADFGSLTTDLANGYSKYKTLTQDHQGTPIIYTLQCNGVADKSPQCHFIQALNDEIRQQVVTKDGNRKPNLIYLPIPLKRSFHSVPAKMFDAAVFVTYEDNTAVQDKAIVFSVDHPNYGKLWGPEQEDCWLVDLRAYDSVQTVQPYASTCNQSNSCLHASLDLPKVFKEENDAHAPLPLDTTYFIEPYVADAGARQRIPRVRVLRVQLSSFE
jgi:hypothetical protein